jgi:cystathionine beta-lyase/cystathionine gamma-synthase
MLQFQSPTFSTTTQELTDSSRGLRRVDGYPRVQKDSRSSTTVLEAPRAVTTMRSNFDGKVMKVINLTSSTIWDFHPSQVIEPHRGLRKYRMTLRARLLSGTSTSTSNSADACDLKQKKDAIILSSGLGARRRIQGLMRKGDLS